MFLTFDLYEKYKSMKIKRLFFSLFFCGNIFIATANNGKVQPDSPGDNDIMQSDTLNTPDDTAFSIQHIHITSVHNDKTGPGKGVAMFGDTIVITVASVINLKKKRSMKNPIVLYINRVAFPNIVGHVVNGDSTNEIKFTLERYYEDNEQWDKVLRTGFIHKSLYIGIGLADGKEYSPVSYPIAFTLRTPAESIPFIVLCISLGCFTVFLVWKKNLLQEKIQGYYIYSLSNVHLFFWTQIILLSYILIWFVCDDMNSIDSSSLVLLGISAGTASVATVLNGNNKKIKNAKAKPSEGFLKDILADNQEFSMHRYQIFIFNAVIGAFFIYKTIGELKMPVLNETVLSLLGISSATYAAIKAIDSKNLLKNALTPTEPPQNTATKTPEPESPE